MVFAALFLNEMVFVRLFKFPVLVAEAVLFATRFPVPCLFIVSCLELFLRRFTAIIVGVLC